MEFRLTYKGRLPAEKWSYNVEYARAEDKHRLRKHFHLQLRELWKVHPNLRRPSVVRSKAANGGQVKTGQRMWPGT
jgi:hypothetical protein